MVKVKLTSLLEGRHAYCDIFRLPSDVPLRISGHDSGAVPEYRYRTGDCGS